MTPPQGPQGPTVFTIGHSNHPPGHFQDLLTAHGIKCVADVRSRPFSRRFPQYNKHRLEADLKGAGLSYHFFGQELGGRPDDRALYREDGRPDLAAILKSEPFRQGIRRLANLARGPRVAVMCAEENPGHCHRRHLVAPALVDLGFSVLHIRSSGRAEPHASDLPLMI